MIKDGEALTKFIQNHEKINLKKFKDHLRNNIRKVIKRITLSLFIS